MKELTFVLLASHILFLGGCGYIAEPRPENPALQQFYRLPQNQYYTAPPPQFQYYDPSKDGSNSRTVPRDNGQRQERMFIDEQPYPILFY